MRPVRLGFKPGRNSAAATRLMIGSLGFATDGSSLRNKGLSMRIAALVFFSFVTVSTSFADGLDEVNEWRRRCGLRPFVEDPEMTRFAKMKARYRAERNLRDGHQGPKPPMHWHEGTGEATPQWGWLTCEMESDYRYAGAGVCVGADGTRYMVLVCRGGSGRALVSRNNSPVHNTAHLTPHPDRVGISSRNVAVDRAAAEDRVASSNRVAGDRVVAAKPPVTIERPPAKTSPTATVPVRTRTVSTENVCPNCGRVH